MVAILFLQNKYLTFLKFQIVALLSQNLRMGHPCWLLEREGLNNNYYAHFLLFYGLCRDYFHANFPSVSLKRLPITVPRWDSLCRFYGRPLTHGDYIKHKCPQISCVNWLTKSLEMLGWKFIETGIIHKLHQRKIPNHCF